MIVQGLAYPVPTKAVEGVDHVQRHGQRLISYNVIRYNVIIYNVILHNEKWKLYKIWLCNEKSFLELLYDTRLRMKTSQFELVNLRWRWRCVRLSPERERERERSLERDHENDRCSFSVFRLISPWTNRSNLESILNMYHSY